MRLLPNLVGCRFGALFLAIGLMVLLGLGPQPEPPPQGSFFAAFGPTGYLTFVKVLEVVGGGLVAIPKTRCLGLLVLGPIVVNILAFHLFVAGDGVMSPMLLGITGASLFLMLVELRAFAGLVTRSQQPMRVLAGAAAIP